MTAPIRPVFVVGTGRCGSTMLTDMLRFHPHRVSISEFWSMVTDLGGRIGESFPPGAVTAEAFWGIVAGIHPLQTTMWRHDVQMDEVLYRAPRSYIGSTGPRSCISSTAPRSLERPSMRFTADHGVPAILQTTIPHLTDRRDALFDEVRAFVMGLPDAPVADHYRALFDWFAGRFGKRGWIERSGGSLRIVTRLQRAFPDARFVHLVRDGRDCALSMSRHPGFRMALIAAQLTEILGVDPYASADRTGEADLPDELLAFLPERFDRAAFIDYRTPLALCAHYWSGECVAGIRELEAIDPCDRMLLRYEDILDAPVQTLGRLAEFLGPDRDCAGWVARAAATVRTPRSSWRSLPARVLDELEAACAPGFAAIDRARDVVCA